MNFPFLSQISDRILCCLLPKLVSLIKKNKINLRKLISGPYKFRNINTIINNIKTGKLITKPILKLEH